MRIIFDLPVKVSLDAQQVHDITISKECPDCPSDVLVRWCEEETCVTLHQLHETSCPAYLGVVTAS